MRDAPVFYGLSVLTLAVGWHLVVTASSVLMQMLAVPA